jgi:hypothetical protein
MAQNKFEAKKIFFIAKYPFTKNVNSDVLPCRHAAGSAPTALGGR